MAIGLLPAAEGLSVSDLLDSEYYKTGVNNWLELSRILAVSNDPGDFQQPYLQRLNEAAQVVFELSQEHAAARGELISPKLQARLELQIEELYKRNQWLENCNHTTLSGLAAGYDEILANLAAFHASPHTCTLIVKRCEYSYQQHCRYRKGEGLNVSDSYLPEIIILLQDRYLQDPSADTLPQLHAEITRRAQHLPANNYSKLYADLYYYLQELAQQRKDNFPWKTSPVEQL